MQLSAMELRNAGRQSVCTDQKQQVHYRFFLFLAIGAQVLSLKGNIFLTEKYFYSRDSCLSHSVNRSLSLA